MDDKITVEIEAKKMLLARRLMLKYMAKSFHSYAVSAIEEGVADGLNDMDFFKACLGQLDEDFELELRTSLFKNT